MGAPKGLLTTGVLSLPPLCVLPCSSRETRAVPCQCGCSPARCSHFCCRGLKPPGTQQSHSSGSECVSSDRSAQLNSKCQRPEEACTAQISYRHGGHPLQPTPAGPEHLTRSSDVYMTHATHSLCMPVSLSAWKGNPPSSNCTEF